MARVLLAWEFGGDLGHIRRVSAIARALRNLGHEPSLALADLAGAPIDDPFPWHQAPLLPMQERANAASLNPSDLLLHLGYGDSAILGLALRAWLGLFALDKARIVVADYAPTALLAARIAGLPCVKIGSGFASPPRGTPMPAYREWQPAAPEILQASDETLLESVNRALVKLHAEPLPGAGALFEADADLLCTFRECDPFGERAGGEYFGPVDHGAAGERVAWRSQSRPRIFAYVKPRYAHFPALLAALAQVAGEAIVAAPRLDAGEAARLSAGNVRVIPRAVELGDVLPGADLCVSHAGAGLAGRALAAGVAQALLPEHLEQFLSARNLGKLGVATYLNPDEPPPDFAAWLRSALDGEALHAAARKAAAPHAGHDNAQAALAVARRIAARLD